MGWGRNTPKHVSFKTAKTVKTRVLLSFFTQRNMEELGVVKQRVNKLDIRQKTMAKRHPHVALNTHPSPRDGAVANRLMTSATKTGTWHDSFLTMNSWKGH